MTLLDRLAQPVTVRTIGRGEKDGHGVRPLVVLAETATTAALQQQQSGENLAGRDQVDADLLAIFPDPAVAIAAGDQVDLGAGYGGVHEVVGRPNLLTGARGRAHLEVRLRRSTDL